MSRTGNVLKRVFGTLFALALFMAQAVAQTNGLPMLPSGGGGGGGITVGSPITGTCPNGQVVFSNSGLVGCEASSGTGTVTSVGWTGGIVSIANPTTVPAFTVAGTSGGVPYFSSTSTWASSGLLSANALMVGGGAGVAPSTVTTGANVLTALGVAVGSAGAFVVNGGALGTPSGGTLTNATGLPAATGIANGALPSGVTINNANWSGAVLGFANGGTGLSALGTANQCLTTNAGVTAMAWAACGGGSSTLTVGSTPTSGGAAGQLMFDTGSVLTESANLTFTTGLLINGASLPTNAALALNYSPGPNTFTPGFAIINPNLASAGNQQPSCGYFSGQGWATTPVASQPTVWQLCVVPVQGAANPTAGLTLASQVNGGAKTTLLDFGVTNAARFTMSTSLAVTGFVQVVNQSLSILNGSAQTTSQLNPTNAIFASTDLIGFSSSTTAITPLDTTLCRQGAGVEEVNAGTGCGATGSLWLASLRLGTAFSAAGTPLPTCNAGSQGDNRQVSDATSPTYMATYTSGGAVIARVFCNGTNWLTD